MVRRFLRFAVPALLGVIAFVAGAVVGEFELPPLYGFFGRALRGGRALEVHLFDAAQAEKTNFWAPTREQAAGTTVWDRERAHDGLTLVVSTHAQQAVLMDLSGAEVHRWEASFRDIWPTGHPGITQFMPPDLIAWRATHLYPNGDLLVLFISFGAAPWGYGLAKLDRDSRPLWRYDENVHHDLDVGPDGAIYTLVHRIDDTPIPELPEITAPYFRDAVVALDPDGNEQWRLDLLDLVVDWFVRRGDRRGLYAIIYDLKGDFLHPNSVKAVPPEFAARHDFVNEGDLVLSFRNNSMLAVCDPRAKRITWARQGPWQGQHDPDLLPNGHILLFDNNGQVTRGGGSSILEYDPGADREVWRYVGDRETFYTDLRGKQQLLPNGNVLATESHGGRLLEITRDHRVVWRWSSPWRAGESGELTAVLMEGTRYDRDALPFLADREGDR